MRFPLITVLLVVSTALCAQSKPDMIYDYPTQMPKFPGSGSALDDFIAENMVYPVKAKESNVQGKVYVQFIVEKNGEITNVQVKRGVHSTLDAEAKRIIESMPNWEPGKSRGKVVKTRHTIPIVFTL